MLSRDAEKSHTLKSRDSFTEICRKTTWKVREKIFRKKNRNPARNVGLGIRDFSKKKILFPNPFLRPQPDRLQSTPREKAKLTPFFRRVQTSLQNCTP